MAARWILVACCQALLLTSVIATSGQDSATAAVEDVSAERSVQETQAVPSALHLVPEDASFFVSSMNQRRQYEAFVQSRAFAELSNMPLSLAMIEAIRNGFEEGSGQSLDDMLVELESTFGEEQINDMIRFGKDVISNEMFIYGSADFTTLADLAQEMNLSLDQVGFGEGQPSQEEFTKAYLSKLDSILDERGDDLKVPDLVFGFRVEDPELARRHVELLHAFVTLGLLGGEAPPPIRRGYRKVKVDDVEFLSLQLSAAMLPLDSMVAEADEAVQPLVEKLVQNLRDEQVAIGVGVLGNYVLISVGDSLEHLNELGQSKPLIDRDEFTGLRKQADRQLAGAAYCSEAFAKALRGKPFGEQLVDAVRVMQASEPDLAIQDPMVQAEVEAMVEEFGKDIDSMQREPAAMSAYTLLTEDGYECFRYCWSVSPFVDGSRPLTILRHVDRDPTLFIAGRAAEPGRVYTLISKWVRRLDPFIMGLVEGAAEDGDVQEFLRFREMVVPYLAKVDTATRELLIPAIQDGQTACVLDFKNARKNTVPGVPPSSEPLVFPELAIICGVNDREKFVEAIAIYDEFAREILNLLAVQAGEEFPDELALPDATSMDFSEGATAYYYPAPQLEAFDLDKVFRPNMMLTDQLAVFSLTMAHSERLLESKPLPNQGPFQRQNQPLAAAAGVNFTSLVNALESWFRYADELQAFDDLQLDDEGPIQLSGDELLESFDTIFLVLRCYQGAESVTYIEDGATVKHSRFRFTDIPW